MSTQCCLLDAQHCGQPVIFALLPDPAARINHLSVLKIVSGRAVLWERRLVPLRYVDCVCAGPRCGKIEETKEVHENNDQRLCTGVPVSKDSGFTPDNSQSYNGSTVS